MTCKFTALLFVLLPLCAPAETTYEFKPYTQKPGETLRMDSKMTTKGGTLIRERDGAKERGTISRARTRQLERRVTGDPSTPRIEYKIVTDIHTTANSLEQNGGFANRTGALVGQTAVGRKDAAGRWILSLEGKPASATQKAELAELDAYENRSWTPGRAVKIGESWKIDPAFLRHLLLRDLETVELRSTLTLTEVREIDGEATAVLACDLQSVGAKDTREGVTDATAALNATGILHVALETMLDKKLLLSGTLSSTARHGDTLSSMSLPLRVEITKSMVKP